MAAQMILTASSSTRYSRPETGTLAALGLPTWAATGADQRRRLRSAGQPMFFRLGGYERPDPPVYGRLGQIRVPAAVVVGDQEYPMVRAAPRTSPPGSPLRAESPRRVPTTCCRCGCRP